jgi:hypothetical protein
MPPVAIAGLIVAALMIAGAVTIAAMPADSAVDSPQSTDLEIYMSNSAGGPQVRSFVSDTNHVFAVVRYEQANHEAYDVRLRDLSGIEVYRDRVVLNGSGSESREISITHFVDSYERGVGTQGDALTDLVADLEGYCQDPPDAPSPWPPEPPANPTPGAPTPTPSDFFRWRALMLDGIESASTTSAELMRTLRATGSLPDVMESPDIRGPLDDAVQDLMLASQKLADASRAVSPPGVGPGTPTPDPPTVPDPARACALVGEASALVDDAIESADSGLDAIPEDTSDWGIPPTTARYDDSGGFASCLQYSTDLVVPERETAADSVPWAVGDAGKPALVFPGPELVDASNQGQMAVSPRELYASAVSVPDVPREARVTAFVTDGQCVPVDGVTMTFGVDPVEAGAVDPVTAPIVDGLVTTRFVTGEAAQSSSVVTGVTCAQDCPRPVTGSGSFTIIGPPYTLQFIVNKTTINPVLGERAHMSVRVVDEFGRNVADGTGVTVSIAAGDPGVLARDVTPQSNPTPQPEVLGKSAQLMTRDGFSYVPPGDDPGLVYSPGLYLMKGNDGEGIVELNAEADNGVKATPRVVVIKSELPVYLPLVMSAYDILATPPFIDPENPPITPTPIP